MTPDQRAAELARKIREQFTKQKDDISGSILGTMIEVAGEGSAAAIALQNQAKQTGVFIEALNASTEEIEADANVLIADILTEIEDEWRLTSGLELTSDQAEVIKDSIVNDFFVPTTSFFGDREYTGTATFDQEAQMFDPETGIANTDLQNIVRFKIQDGQTQVLRFPTHYTVDKQIGEIARQLDKAGIIDTEDRDAGSAVLEAIRNNLSTFKRQIDEVTSETNKNFSNAIDTLIENANPALPPTQPEQLKKVAAYQWINELNNPVAQTLPPNMLQAIVQEQYSQEPEMQKQIESYTKNFQDLIKTLNPIFSNDPAASYKQNILNDMLKSTVAEMEMVKFDPELNSQQKLEALNQLQVTFDKGSEDGSVPGIAEAFKRAETQYGIDRATQTRDNANRNPEQFQQNYLQASASERKILDEDLNILNQQGYSITPSGKFVEQADPLNLRPFANLDFDPSTIKDPTARQAMAEFMAYTQGLTPQQQFNMQLGVAPPSLPQSIMQGFENIGRPLDSQIPIDPIYSASDFGQGTTEGSFDLTPEGGLDQKDFGSNISFQEPDLMYQTEDFDLRPSAKSKPTEEFDELRGM